MHLSLLFLVVVVVGTVLADCPSSRPGLLSWSSASTWPNGIVPSSGDVTLPVGKSVLLNVATLNVNSITVPTGSSLIFSDTMNFALTLNTLMVETSASLWIGSSDCPFAHNVVITLTGTKNSVIDNATHYGQKTIVTDGGQIEMHGQNPGIVYTKLAQTAHAGATTITLLVAPTGWKVGQTIMIVSTDFDPNETEIKVITAINGNTITLNSPLAYMHWGNLHQYVDERAEVALLSRNIIVQGDTNSASQSYGGHMMFIGAVDVHLSYIEVTRAGQQGILARYPVHFHMCVWNSTGSTIIGLSIHDNYQRAITVHNSNGVLLQDNVAYNTHGHMFFLENGSERNNTWLRNLGVLTVPIPGNIAVIPTDGSASIFWITNSNNDFIDNIAVGSTTDLYGTEIPVGFGACYWFNLPTHPINLSTTTANNDFVWPTYMFSGKFTGNVAHSASLGFWNEFVLLPDNTVSLSAVFSSYPKNFTVNYFNPLPNPTDPSFSMSTLIENYIQPAPQILSNCVAWKTGQAAWWVESQAVFQNWTFADNIYGVTFELQGSLIGGYMVGETDNIGNPTGGLPRSKFGQDIYGYSQYDVATAPMIISGVTFFNFTDITMTVNGKVITRTSAAISDTAGGNKYMQVPANALWDNQFIQVTNRVYWQYPTKFWNAGYNEIWIDRDGSTSDFCGGYAVSGYNPLLVYPTCTTKYTTKGTGYMCPAGNSFIDMFVYGQGDKYPNSGMPFQYPAGYSGNISLDLINTSLQLTRLSDGATGYFPPVDTIQVVNGYEQFLAQFQGLLRVNHEYALEYLWTNPPNVTQFTMYTLYIGEWIRFAIPYPAGTTFNVSPNNVNAPNYVQVASKAQLTSNTYYFDGTWLWLHFQGVEQGWANAGGWYSQSYGDSEHVYNYPERIGGYTVFIFASCPNHKCGLSFPLGHNLVGKSTNVPTAAVTIDRCIYTSPDYGFADESWSVVNESARISIWKDGVTGSRFVANDNANTASYTTSISTTQLYNGRKSFHITDFHGSYSGWNVNTPFNPLSLFPAGNAYIEMTMKIPPYNPMIPYPYTYVYQYYDTLNGLIVNSPGAGRMAITPRFSGQFKTLSSEWYTYRIPLSDYMNNVNPNGLWSSLTFGGINLHAEFYLADVSIVQLTKNVFPSGYVGCFTTQGMTAALSITSNATTVEQCNHWCGTRGYTLAGVQAGNKCMCANTYSSTYQVAQSSCTSPCVANPSEQCGGPSAVGISYVGDVGYLGCYIDQNNRDMPGYLYTSNSMTIEQCRSECGAAGYEYAGVQYGSQCFCGSSYGKYGTASSASCTTSGMSCAGDSTQKCGNLFTNAVYTSYNRFNGVKFTDISVPPTQAVQGYLGCYVDSNTVGRDMTLFLSNLPGNNVENCVAACAVRNYQYAGVQDGENCWCGNSYGSHGRAPDTDCNMPCGGNSKEICGGFFRNAVYDTYFAGYKGCYVDNGASTRDLGYQTTIPTSSVTIQNCRQTCSSLGYLYAGVQFANQCFCGNKYGTYGLGVNTTCNMPCSGDSVEICGGVNRNSVYRVY